MKSQGYVNVAMPFAFIGAVWVAAGLFYFVPLPSSYLPWWSIPWVFTVFGAAVVAWMLIGAALAATLEYIDTRLGK